ncbi:MAG: Lrp/AsnC family transcriptional regulator [Candidatus Altiarchaeota archaeon]|nr:Lrp/AsnC family transcriptional regulator [Candidatus Altiarchaeota archaeon]
MELDNIDKQVLFLFSKDPDICQQALAQHVGVTQPAICLRLQKLKKRGIINEGHDINFNALGMKLSLAKGQGNLEKLKKSPYFVAGFETKTGLTGIFCGENEETAKAVPKMMMKTTTSVEAIASFDGNFGIRLRKKGECGLSCKKCKAYGKCLGLPGTKWYVGKLWKVA